MKIFNIQPIKITKYIFNEEHLTKGLVESSYESGFSYNGKKSETVNTLLITFDIRYYVGTDAALLLYYKSHCQFEFESEGFEADVLSITKFLSEYHAHTNTFFQQYGLKDIQEKEEQIGIERGASIVHLANWVSLKTNDFYSNRFSAISVEETLC